MELALILGYAAGPAIGGGLLEVRERDIPARLSYKIKINLSITRSRKICISIMPW